MPLLYTKEPPTAAPPALLTPENCLSNTRIRAFLRLSRFATDDNISHRLSELGSESCDSYFRTSVVPQWRARAQAIDYCADYAQDLRHHTKAATQEAAADLRIDPYAVKNAKDAAAKLFDRCAAIEAWVANERGVEAIIRDQSASVLSDKCAYKDWLAEFKRLA